jgi:riboflavin-specific deaminase-like protein
MTHQLRAAHDAIVVGIGTVSSDDPQLNVRLVEGKDPQPVVLDSHLAFPERARLLENPIPPWIAAVNPVNPDKEAYLTGRGARVLHLPPDPNGRVEITALLDRLADLNIKSILVEGGSSIIASFFQCQLVNRVVVTISPVFVGGLKVVEGLLSPMPRLNEFHSIHLGDDVIVWGVPAWQRPTSVED